MVVVVHVRPSICPEGGTETISMLTYRSRVYKSGVKKLQTSTWIIFYFSEEHDSLLTYQQGKSSLRRERMSIFNFPPCPPCWAWLTTVHDKAGNWACRPKS